jgi:hypothetical protein
MQVEIYKTNVQEAIEASVILKMLLEHFSNYKINFDLSNCDRILRVEGAIINIEKISFLVNNKNYECELIPDQ